MTVKSDLWEALAAEHRSALGQLGTRIQYAAGETILREHEPSSHVLLLDEGTAKVVVTADNGQEVILALREGPDIVGEMAALDGTPRSASVVAKTRITATVVTAEHLNDFLQRNPEVLLTLVRTLASRLRDSDQARLEMASRTVLQRIAGQLLALHDQYTEPDRTQEEGPRQLPVTQNELASMVGASREAVAKALLLLRKHGLVTTGRGRITVVDLPALRVITEEL
ncbi:Crp/Fnr family transcriptional regulator [Kitasatospora sp. NPDC004289]